MAEDPLVLGIETSCDETGIGLVRGERLLADAVASSVEEHARFGGVVPEVASRAHLEAMVPTIERACAQAGVRLGDVDAVAVTAGPGLAGALTVGVAAAKALAVGLAVPLHGVNHLAAHVAVDVLEHGPLPEPTMALLVSGGHSSLLLVPDVTADVRPLGRTIDDAAGEAFDKVARLLGLPFPGGPHIDRQAGAGDAAAIEFPRGLSAPHDLERHRYDFSFSGLKTAVARWVERREAAGQVGAGGRRRGELPGSRGRRADPQGGGGLPGARGRGPADRGRGRSELTAAGVGTAALRCGGDPPARAAARAVHRQRGDGRGPGRADRAQGPPGVRARPAGRLRAAGHHGDRLIRS